MTGFLYARLGKRYKTKGCRMGIYLYHSNVFDCSTQNKRYRTVLPNLEVVVMMMMMNPAGPIPPPAENEGPPAENEGPPQDEQEPAAPPEGDQDQGQEPRQDDERAPSPNPLLVFVPPGGVDAGGGHPRQSNEVRALLDRINFQTFPENVPRMRRSKARENPQLLVESDDEVACLVQAHEPAESFRRPDYITIPVVDGVEFAFNTSANVDPTTVEEALNRP